MTHKLYIQPITIKYLTDITYGYGNEFTQKHHLNIPDNMKQMLKYKENPVNITFHPVVNPRDFKNANHLKDYVKLIITDEWINQTHIPNRFTNQAKMQ